MSAEWRQGFEDGLAVAADLVRAGVGKRLAALAETASTHLRSCGMRPAPTADQASLAYRMEPVTIARGVQSALRLGGCAIRM